jgi:hypothetical protein
MSERLHQLLDDLTDLPDRQSGALLMRELSGLSYAEIGVALDTSEQAARQSVYEARVMLLDLEKGRAMGCDDVRRRVSARDGRLLRPRHVRAPLRVCGDCTAFREAIGVRRAELAALSPPVVPLAGAALLRAFFSQGHHEGSGLAATFARAADPLAASLTTKGAALVAAAALAGGGSLVTQHGGAPSRAAGGASGGSALTVPGPTQRGDRVAPIGPVQDADQTTRPLAATRLPGIQGPSQAPPQAPRGADAPAVTLDRDTRPSADTAPAPFAPESAPTRQPETQPAPAATAPAGDQHGAAGAKPGNGNGDGHASTTNPGNANPGNANPGNANPGNANPGNANANPGNASNPNPGGPGGQGKAPGKG